MGVALRGYQAFSVDELEPERCRRRVARTVRLSEAAHLSPVFRVDIADETSA